MFEISKLKEKKLAELQEIAEELKISKYKTLKKLDLVYKILDHQASNPGDKGDEIKSSSKPKFSPKSRSNKNDVNDKRSNDDENVRQDKKTHNHPRDNKNRKTKSEPNGNMAF